jgi:hypothetical protein
MEDNALARNPHLARLIDEGIYTIVFLDVKNPDTGQPGYLYLAVMFGQLAELKEAFASGHFRPQDFGVILEGGLGLPTPEVKHRMERDFGFDHNTPLVFSMNDA